VKLIRVKWSLNGTRIDCQHRAAPLCPRDVVRGFVSSVKERSIARMRHGAGGTSSIQRVSEWKQRSFSGKEHLETEGSLSNRVSFPPITINVVQLYHARETCAR